MKKILLTLTIASLILGACMKKDSKLITDNKVEYSISCKECKVTMDVASGTKTVDVKDFFVRSEINTLPVINISTIGVGEITVKLKVDGKELYSKTNNQTDGETIKHTIKR